MSNRILQRDLPNNDLFKCVAVAEAAEKSLSRRRSNSREPVRLLGSRLGRGDDETASTDDEFSKDRWR